ncbi:hypothetical protein J6590_060475 [Homalodisca vitripennis]|nr:hypothetical protein J6590_060475 [Homalodisca vitripennis]
MPDAEAETSLELTKPYNSKRVYGYAKPATYTLACSALFRRLSVGLYEDGILSYRLPDAVYHKWTQSILCGHMSHAARDDVDNIVTVTKLWSNLVDLNLSLKFACKYS